MNLATGIDTILHCVDAVGSRTVSPLLVDIGDYLGVHVVRSNHNLATLEHWSPVTQIQRYRLECQTIDVSLWSERDQIPVVRNSFIVTSTCALGWNYRLRHISLLCAILFKTKVQLHLNECQGHDRRELS